MVLLLCLAPVSSAATVTLSWDPNTESDLAGYIVVYGTASGSYSQSIDVGLVTTYTCPQLGSGTFFFAVQAYNTSGLTSPLSNEVSATIAPPPATAPTITSVSPSSGPVAGATRLTVTGTNFVSGAVVWVGAAQAVNAVVVNSTTITALTPAGSAGAADVRVTNPDAFSALKAGAFTYVDDDLRVTAVEPPTGLSAGGLTVTITGSKFAPGAVVLIGGTTATSVKVLNSTSLTAVTPSHAVGAADVSVTVSGKPAGNLPGGFTYVQDRPGLASISPSSGSTAGGTAVTVKGSNFAGGALLKIGGVAARNVRVLNETTITATTSPYPVPITGAEAVDVTVANPNAQAAVLIDAFTFEKPVLAVASVWPTSGPVGGGTRVTLTGTNFENGAVVTFGGTRATAVTVSSPTTLSVTTPSHAAGPVRVEVRLASGQAAGLDAGYAFVGSDDTTDTDNDGMPDAWESRYGLNPNSASGDDGAGGDPDGDGVCNADEYKAGTHPRGFVKRYFAEGVNTSFFSTRFALFNPDESPAEAVLLFLRENGVKARRALTLPARTRVTLDASDVAGLEDSAFSTAIECDRALVADRTVSWDKTGYGAHAETAIASPGTVWYLAEGATHSGFDLFYLIQNPNPAAATVQVKYLLPAGAPLVKTYTVKANSRYTIWVDLEDARLAQTDVSAVITSVDALPVIVERAMYANSGGKPFGAGSAGAGVTEPATRWFLAEGATGPYFDLFVLIANPSDQAALVKATFLKPNGSTIVKQYTVKANSRFNIWVDLEDPALADTAVSTTIESLNGVPVIVERSMWWPGPTPANWRESHSSVGATRTATRWALAEGEESSADDHRTTYVLIANTSSWQGQAHVTVYFEDGMSAEQWFPLAANSRFNVAMATEFPWAAGKRFSVIVESTGDQPAELVVERAMYWDAGGEQWAAGTNAMGTPLDERP